MPSVNSLISRSVQYLRHLHEKVRVIDDRTAPPTEDQAAAQASAAAAAGLIGAYGLSNDILMITNGSSYGGKLLLSINVYAYFMILSWIGGYGGMPAPGVIPDPYAQPSYGGYGAPGYPAPGYGPPTGYNQPGGFY